MTSEMLRERLRLVVADRPAKIALARAAGHGFDFLWTLGGGPGRPAVVETLAHRGPYYLFGEAVPEELLPEILDFFERFCTRELGEAPLFWPST